MSYFSFSRKWVGEIAGQHAEYTIEMRQRLEAHRVCNLTDPKMRI